MSTELDLPEPLRSQLKHIEDMRRDFVANVSHELRTPLTIVHGAMRILESRLDDQVSKKLANSSIKSSEHLSTLIDSILKFSNINTGELQLNEQSTNMAELLDDVQQNHQFSVAEVGKTITTPTSDMHGEILVDQEHIKICLTSLMLNSVLHGGDEETISDVVMHALTPNAWLSDSVKV